MKHIISIRNLTVQFHTYDGTITAVDDISLDINRNETYGLVGETGCGKTVMALSILRLVPPPGNIQQGNINFWINEVSPIKLLAADEEEMRRLRGNRISMIFQEPGSALNPVYTIGDQIAEIILLHRRDELAKRVLGRINISPHGVLKKLGAVLTKKIEKSIYKKVAENPRTRLYDILERFLFIRKLLWRSELEAIEMVVGLLKDVGIPDPERVVHQYPHELSGGMKQRCVIAMALACNPTLLIADEPTTALDVTIQAQILNLLRQLKVEHNTSILYITHDLSVSAEICDRVGVMYAGRLCEEAGVVELYENPLHPYTKALMAAVPRPGELPHSTIGSLPDISETPVGCKFYLRCSIHKDFCLSGKPELREITPGHFVACHLL
ncbi:ABC transporter ATP-binding protein [Chloroflexota bacterium]